LYERFVKCLRLRRPEVWEELQQQEEKKRRQREAEHALSQIFKAAPGSGGDTDGKDSSSSFGFGFNFQLSTEAAS
jgi:hypothetical protein